MAPNYAMYSLGGGIGPVLTAKGVARTGDYATVLWALAAMLVVAASLLVAFKPFPAWNAARSATAATAR